MDKKALSFCVKQGRKNKQPIRPTIKEVAKVAGFSSQTVSRVCNNRPDVSPETREHIQGVIAELGYYPNALARSLIHQRSFTLGVVTAATYDGLNRSLYGITRGAEELGYSLLLKILPGFSTVEILPVVETLLSWHVDGLLWAVPEVGGNLFWLEKWKEPPLPTVFLSMETQIGLPVVSIDNAAGAALAVKHLIERGYRWIGHIAGPQDWWEARQRLLGWRKTLIDANLPAEDHQWCEGNWLAGSGEVAVKKLKEQFPKLDAVFVANEQMALAVLHWAARNAIRVPADLAVVGFDGRHESAYFSPALTTVFQDLHLAGRRAVEMLARRIECKNVGDPPAESDSLVIQPELLIRGSS